MRVVALLDTMWGDRECRAPRYFRINPHNLSGKRLYRMVGDANLFVTNCCPIMQTSARHHGTPDAAWVLENLQRLEPFDVLLVCGSVAAKTYKEAGYLQTYGTQTIHMKHPAARSWTKSELEQMQRRIADVYAAQATTRKR